MSQSTTLTEPELHSAYINGDMARAEYMSAIVALHASYQPGHLCTCLACNETSYCEKWDADIRR